MVHNLNRNVSADRILTGDIMLSVFWLFIVICITSCQRVPSFIVFSDLRDLIPHVLLLIIESVILVFYLILDFRCPYWSVDPIKILMT